MLAAFGVDVLDPAVSCRRVGVLLDRLPPTAREQDQVWTVEAELLASVVDALVQLTYVTLCAHGAKPGKPKPVKRPPRHARDARRVTRDANRYTAAVSEGQAPSDTRSWSDAAAVLAGLPGVTVHHG